MADTPWVLRSLLFVPGSRPAMIARARTLEPDAIILDLEDGVAPDEKEQARRAVAGALEEGFPESLIVFVRVNGSGSGLLDTDLREAFRPRCDGVCLPKCGAPASALAVDARLRALEDRWAVPHGKVRLFPMIESAQSMLSAPAIARACGRICALGFGGEDFTADLGLARSREGAELAWGRTAVSLAAHAAGVPPIDGIFADFRDEEGLRADTCEARRCGFAGKMLIHPAQIAPVHAAFAPTSEEVEHARKIVAVFAKARAAGSGVAVVDGTMVDRPVVLRAERVLAAAARGGHAPGAAGIR